MMIIVRKHFTIIELLKNVLWKLTVVFDLVVYFWVDYRDVNNDSFVGFSFDRWVIDNSLQPFRRNRLVAEKLSFKPRRLQRQILINSVPPSVGINVAQVPMLGRWDTTIVVGRCLETPTNGDINYVYS